MSYRRANLAALQARFPDLARRLEGVAPDPAMEARSAPSGEPTARWRGAWLHGLRDPRREARSLAGREATGKPTAGILIGFGLGYLVEAFRELHPGVPLLVIEPSAALFVAALETRDLASLFRDPDLRLLVGGEPSDASLLVEDLPLDRPAVLRLRAEADRDREVFRTLDGVVQSALLRREINVNTLARFGRLWVRNLASNLARFAEAPGVALLAGRFVGLPAVILAGGPTLEDLLPVLPRIRERGVIVAVNTPLAACLRGGVEPDAVVVVDPQYWASRHLDWAPAETSWIVAEPSTHPRSLRLGNGRLFFTGSVFPLGQRLEKAVGAKGKLGAGGSVATTAWDFARMAGCSPLYAAGLDLGYPERRTHCRPATFEEARRFSAGKLAPLETFAFGSLREIGLFASRSTAGGAVATDRRMVLYRRWFEEQLAAAPCKAFLLSDRGVAIEGMPCAPMDELLALPPRRAEIDERKRAIERELDGRPPADPARQALAALLDRLIEELSGLELLASEAERRTRALATELGAGRDPGSSLAALDRLDREILACSARAEAGFLVQSVIHAIRGGGADRRESVHTSGALYAGLAESARFQAELLGRALARLATG